MMKRLKIWRVAERWQVWHRISKQVEVVSERMEEQIILALHKLTLADMRWRLACLSPLILHPPPPPRLTRQANFFSSPFTRRRTWEACYMDTIRKKSEKSVSWWARIRCACALVGERLLSPHQLQINFVRLKSWVLRKCWFFYRF